MVKSLNLSKEDRMILGHVVFGRDELESSILIGITKEKVIQRRKELMVILGELGVAANENMLGISLFKTMIEGLNSNLFDKKGKEIPNHPDMKTRLATVKIFNLITGGMLGRALTRFMDRMFDCAKSQELALPPEWIDTLDPQSRN